MPRTFPVPMSSRALVLGCLALVGLPGCTDGAARKCHDEMTAAQTTLLAMNAGDRANVEQALGAVNATLATCRAAGRADEVRELEEARANLSGHVETLKKRAERGAPHALAPDELKKLVEKGDPSCPRGHAYEHGDSKQTIRCTGPQLYEMAFAVARDHYSRRGFSVAVDATKKQLRAEYGAEVAIFSYDEAESKKPPTCLTLVASPGVPWQEVITRATGVPPARLVEGKSLVLDGRELPFRLEGAGPDKTVHLGGCPPAGGAAKAPEAGAADPLGARK